jgi:hypothetical protein
MSAAQARRYGRGSTTGRGQSNSRRDRKLATRRPHYFERRVCDLSDDFWFSEAFSRAFSRLAESASYTEPVVLMGFIAAVIPI